MHKRLGKTGMVLIFSVMSMLFLSACASPYSDYRRQVINFYMPAGWFKFRAEEQLKPPKKYSGYQLIQQAKKIDGDLKEVIDFYGQPDYVRAAAKNKLNLAYLQRGIVLSFTLKSSVAPYVIEYERFNNLSQRLAKLFKENHHELD